MSFSLSHADGDSGGVAGTIGTEMRDLFVQLCSGQAIDGQGLMVAVSRLKDPRSRADLVAAAREYAPNLQLSRSSFLTIVDLFRVCLREGNNGSHFKCLRNIFNASYQYGMDEHGNTFFVGRQLQAHEAWRNVHFWLFCADELIRHDILRFTYWFQRSTNSPVLPLEDSMFIATVVVIRLQSIIFNSMQLVRVPPDVVLDFINTAAGTYGLSAAKVDLLRRPTADFVAWLQDTIIFEMKSDLAPYLNEQNLSGGIYRSSSIEANLDKVAELRSPVIAERTVGVLSYDMGFCPLLELLYRLIVKRSSGSQSAFVESRRPSSFGVGSSSNGVHNALNGNSTPPIAGPTISCVCGHSTGSWTVIGDFSKNNSMLSRKYIKHVLCETCYRRVIQSDPLPAQVLNIVPMGACTVPMSWPGNLPNTFVAIFYGNVGLPDFDQDLSLKINTESLRSSFSRLIKETLIDRSDNGPPRNLSNSSIVKILAAEGKELTSIGIGTAIHSRSPSLSSDGGASSTRPARRSESDRDIKGPIPLTPSKHSESAIDIRSKRSKVASAKDSIRVQRDRNMLDPHLGGFVSAMQSGIDIMKFGHNLIHPLQMRTFFIDKDVTRLCWLPPGREELEVVEKSSVLLKDIRRIRKGTGKYEQCLNIVCVEREITLQVEDPELRKLVLSGLVGLVEKIKKKEGDTGSVGERSSSSSTKSR